MKIVLIQPPSSKRFEIIPIGIAYIAALLQEKGHVVKIIDACAPYAALDTEEVVKEVKSFSPDLAGITITTAICKEAYKLAREISNLNITTVAGGPHPSALPYEALHNAFDIVVRGEGEYTMLEITEFLQKKKQLSEILGISYKDKDGQIFDNPSRPFISNLDELPFPARDLFPLNNYVQKESLGQINFFWSILTSRGCPNACIYCASFALGKRYRYRSAENVYRELKQLREKYKIRYFRFLDDTLTADEKRLNELLDLIIADKQLEIRWDCDSRVNTITEELLLKMKRAGCNGVTYGVESADPETLRRIRKGISLAQVERAISASIKADLTFVINLMLGWPWETERHIENTVRLVKSIPKTTKCSHQYSLPIPFPETPLYQMYHKEYGFTDWWLKEDAYEGDYDETGYIAFYKLYMRYLNHPFFKNDFFRYSPRIKKVIIHTFIIAGRLSNRRIFGSFSEKIICLLSRLSSLLYKINPQIERLIFRTIRLETIKEIAKRALKIFDGTAFKFSKTSRSLRKIKILHLIESLGKGGAEKRLVKDLKNIDKNRFTNVVCCLFENGGLEFDIPKLDTVVYNLALKSIYEFPGGFFRLLQIINLERPDIIHTQLFAADIYGRILGKLFRIPVVSTIQSSVYEPGIEFFYSPKRKWLDSLSGRFCNTRFIAVSEFVKESIIKNLHFRTDKIKVIYNYIDIGEVDSFGSRIDMREKLGLAESDILLITIGKLNAPKGHRYLLEAMPYVVERVPSVKLLIAGTGPDKNALLNLKDNLGLDNSVLFLGERDDVYQLLFLSDIFVFPSLSEGLPLSLLEAMALEKPCIACNLGPMPEVIENEKTGILVEPKNPKAISEAVLDLIGAPEKASRLSHEAREYISEKFTAGKNIKELEKLYEAILNHR